ncbi:MAG TPA: MoaD/ThiS family protein [Euryarchaeota archaeon]|nr:molybdopterin synthase sulfur carrier subunit [archaeon BMS3Abin16]HDH28054.1 MoaD/ThiS family protein [Euryarchaeota archaeon]HDY73531.1 MoaD/ThiS family protein [Euryarchaeota archaeon]
MVSIRLFAGFREKIGAEKIEVSVPVEIRLEDFIRRLGSDYPEIGALIEKSRATIAVNHEIVGMDQIISDSDEIALFPPVSGG